MKYTVTVLKWHPQYLLHHAWELLSNGVRPHSECNAVHVDPPGICCQSAGLRRWGSRAVEGMDRVCHIFFLLGVALWLLCMSGHVMAVANQHAHTHTHTHTYEANCMCNCFGVLCCLSGKEVTMKDLQEEAAKPSFSQDSAHDFLKNHFFGVRLERAPGAYIVCMYAY